MDCELETLWLIDLNVKLSIGDSMNVPFNVDFLEERTLCELASELSARRLCGEDHLEFLCYSELLLVCHLVDFVYHLGPDIEHPSGNIGFYHFIKAHLRSEVPERQETFPVHLDDIDLSEETDVLRVNQLDKLSPGLLPFEIQDAGHCGTQVEDKLGRAGKCRQLMQRLLLELFQIVQPLH